MARRVLDTNILINHWGDTFGRVSSRQITVRHADQCARKLISSQGTNSILTPIYVEFLCGQRSAHEVTLAKKFLASFEVLDQGRILPVDWENAKRIAARVPKDGLRRQMGDCLIRALCDRLKVEVFTFEKRFPH